MNTFMQVVITLAIVAAVGAFIQLSRRAMRLLGEAETFLRYLNGLRPRVDRIVEAAQKDLSTLGRVTNGASHVLENVEAISAVAKRTAVPIAALQAVLMAVRGGVGLFRRRKPP